jgi:uncharacterized protein
VNGRVPSWARSNSVLHLVILPTEGCNFRCVYCYEDFALSRMSPSVVSGVERLLTARFPELERLDVSWFGGEPLLASDIMVTILEHVAELRANHPETAFVSDVTTNAYQLDGELLRRLVGLGVQTFQITLDGTGPAHDLKRRRADGRGTFDVIWSNLMTMRASDVPFEAMLRLHVDRTNREDMARLLDECGGAFRDDPRFAFFIRPLSRLGGAQDARLPSLDTREAPEVLAALKNHAIGLGLRLWEGANAEPVCYAARPNSLVIRADGRINKCTVALRDPRNTVGHLHADGTVSLDRDAMLPWIRGMWTGRRTDLVCPFSGLKASAEPLPEEPVSQAVGDSGLTR